MSSSEENCWSIIVSAPSSLFQKVAFWRPLIAKWSPQKNPVTKKKNKNREGEDTS